MRRFLSMVLAVLLVLSTCVIGVFATSETPDVEENDTNELPAITGADVSEVEIPEYEAVEIPEDALPIKNALAFASMDPYGVYYLASDLTLNVSYAGEFSGKLFGNGKTVTTAAPLFEKLVNAYICDLTVAGEITTTDPALYTGAIARKAEGVTLQSVTNNATVTGIIATAGMIGQLKDTSSFINCVNNGEITAVYFEKEDGSYTLGEAAGIVGSLADNVDNLVVTFKHCVNNADISAYCNAAGILGWSGDTGKVNQTINAEGCINNGNVTQLATPAGGNGYRAAGLFGTIYASRFTINNCVNFGDINNQVARAGGILGYYRAKDNNLVITNTANYGAVSSIAADGTTVNNQDCGGIVGNLEPNGSFLSVTFDNCYNGGAVTGGRVGGIYGAISSNSWAGEMNLLNCTNDAPITSVNYAGGLAARIDGMSVVISNCVNTEKGVVSAPSGYAGGFIGFVEFCKGVFTVENCRNDGDVNVSGIVAGMLASFREQNSSDYKVNYASGHFVFDNCINNGDITSATSQAGGIVGIANSLSKAEFTDCVNNGTITGRYSGGIASRVQTQRYGAYFERCYNTGDVIGVQPENSTDYWVTAGGIMSHNSNAAMPMLSFVDCHNSGDISTPYSKADGCGGLAGAVSSRNVVFDGCTNSGAVYAASSNAGGLAGTANGAGSNGFSGLGALTVTNCYNEGTITADKGNPCGIVSYSTSDKIVIDNCVNVGTITAATVGGQKPSGIASRIQTKNLVAKNCLNVGDITGNSETGGIIAYNAFGDGAQNTIENCVQIGNVHSTGATPVGGIYGKALDGNFFAYNCVTIGNVSNSGSSQVGGILGSKGNHDNGYHEFNSCLVVGDITNGGANNSTGGIAGYMNCNASAGPSVFNCAVYSNITGLADCSAFIGYMNGGLKTNYMKNNLFVGTLNCGTAAADAADQFYTFLAVHSGAIQYPAANVLNNYYYADIELLLIDTSHNKVELDDEVNFPMTSADQNVTEGLGAAWVYIAEDDAIVVSEDVSVSGNLPVAAVKVLKKALGMEVVDEYTTITTAEEFAAMDPDGNYVLGADITISASYAYVFTGKLNGAGYTINTTAPVFAAVEGAEISNLTIAGAISGYETTIGALAATADGITVTDVCNKADLTNLKLDANKDVMEAMVGGLVGTATGEVTVINCKNEGDITGSTVGGFIGNVNKPAEVCFVGCVNVGTISPFSAARAAGGFIGSTYGSGKYEFVDCINNGYIACNIGTYFTTRAGGFVGYMKAGASTVRGDSTADIYFTNCVNAENVLGGDQTGGFLGWTEGSTTLKNCYNFGNVLSWSNYGAGMVGRADRNSYFEDCYNYGDVSTARQYAAGLIGYVPNRALDDDTAGKDISGSYQVKWNDVFFLRCGNFGDVKGNANNLRNEGKSNNYWMNAGGLAGTIMAGDFYYCVSIGDIAGSQQVGGLVGSLANGNPIDNRCNVIGNFVAGKLTSTGALYNAADSNGKITEKSDKSYGIGGLWGYANGSNMTHYVMNNVVMADLELTSPHTTIALANQPLAAGLACYYNVGGSTFTNNVFVGSIKTHNGKAYATIWSQNASVNHTANFVSVEGDCYYFRKGSADEKMANYAAYIIGEDTILPYSLVAVDDYLMCSQAAEVYGMKDLTVLDLVPEDALKDSDVPETPDVPGDETTEEVTTEDVTTEEVTTEEVTTEEVTTEEVTTEEVTTEEVTTEEVTTEEVTTEEVTTEEVTTEEVTTEEVTTAAPEGDTTGEEEGGCGSVIGASAIVVALALVAPAAIMLKKKED